MIVVLFAGQEINKSPFDVKVGPKKYSDIVAFGPGLRGGIVGYPAAFVVETNGETGSLGFTIAGPSQAEIECHDNGDGSALVKYHPTAPGDYSVHILCDEDDIPKSPFIAHVVPRSDFRPELVKVFGSGIEKSGPTVGELAKFTIDTSQAGNAQLEANLYDTFCNKKSINLQKEEEGIYKCSYKTTASGPHTVEGKAPSLQPK